MICNRCGYFSENNNRICKKCVVATTDLQMIDNDFCLVYKTQDFAYLSTRKRTNRSIPVIVGYEDYLHCSWNSWMESSIFHYRIRTFDMEKAKKVVDSQEFKNAYLAHRMK